MRDRLTPPDEFPIPSDRYRAIRSMLMTEATRATSVRRHSRRALATTVAVLILATAGIAGAASKLLAPATEVPPGDRAAAIARLGADIPLPPDGSFDALVDGDYLEEEQGLAATLAYNAWCQWSGRWIDGALNGDKDQQREAQEVMAEVPSWPQLIAVDDSGTTTAALARIAAAAADGDVDTVVYDYQVNCSRISAERDALLAEGWGEVHNGDIDLDSTCRNIEIELAQIELDPAGHPTGDTVHWLETAADDAATGPAQMHHLAELLDTAAQGGDISEQLAAAEAELETLCQPGS